MKHWKQYLGIGVLLTLLLPLFGCEGCQDEKTPTEPSEKSLVRK